MKMHVSKHFRAEEKKRRKYCLDLTVKSSAPMEINVKHGKGHRLEHKSLFDYAM